MQPESVADEGSEEQGAEQPGQGQQGRGKPAQEQSAQELGQPTLEQQGQVPVNLVDLIEQPAWKTILIDLVKSEKMDPWDINLVNLADLYWQKIQQLERADLRIPANAILASAILLKLKARTIKLSSIEEEEEETKEISKEELAMIEESLPELSGQRQFREGKITLDELVGSIETILEKTKSRRSILREAQIPDFKVAISEEDIEKKIGQVYERIRERADSQGLLTFSVLLDGKTTMEMVGCFLALLFLINKGRVNAWQEEFFGEIFISLPKEGS